MMGKGGIVSVVVVVVVDHNNLIVSFDLVYFLGFILK
jgi:hypothetical protein